MIEYEMRNVDKRKQQIIERLGGNMLADAMCPRQDRVIIADLTISAVEKVMATLNTHLDAGAQVLSGSGAPSALMLVVLCEIEEVMRAVQGQVAAISLQEMLDAVGPDQVIRDLEALLKSRKS